MTIGMIRYAIPNVFKDRSNSRDVASLYEEPYFSDRFNIFRNVTLESFNQQTNKNFKLLIYHTNSIPDDKKILFNELEKQYPFIQNLYIENGEMYIPEELKEDINLTFRIDNDDGIAVDFIEKLEAIKTNYTEDLIISIPHIYKIGRCDKETYNVMQLDYPSNSIGLAYLTNAEKTIMDLGNHYDLVSRFKSKLLDGNGGLQIINGYNVANSFENRAGKNKSTIKDMTLDELKHLLIQNNYPDLDISILPILEERKNND